jgi:outer membrane protein assembly factor BamA
MIYLRSMRHEKKQVTWYGWLWAVLILFAPFSNFSQEKIPVSFEEELISRFDMISFPEHCQDSLGLLKQIDSLDLGFRNLGYLAAGAVTIQKREGKYLVDYQTGKQYSWMEIRTGNLSPDLLANLGFYPNFWKGKVLHYEQVARLMQDILDHYANHGHPFAQVRLDSVTVEDTLVSTSMTLVKNKVFLFDSINLISTVAINPKFLERHLGLRKGELYDQSKVDQIPERIKNLSFVRLDEPPRVQFKGNRVIVHLKLAPFQNSRFDILIGIQPNDEGENRVRITGEISADLINRLGQGEYAGFRYKSIAQGTQDLSLKLNYPYLLNLPFGIESDFKIYSNNSLNRDIEFKLGIHYQLNNDQAFSIYWHNSSSRLLSIDTAKILAQRKLPANLDVRLNGIGMSFAYENLNYRYNPRSGIDIHLNAKTGFKDILANEEIKSIANEWVDFSNSYDTLQGGFQFSLESSMAYYLPFGKVFTLKSANQSGIQWGRQKLFRNEAYRIGGSSLLRGFDEESLYANRFSIFTLETRLLISNNSYFFVFADYGLVNVLIEDEQIYDQPYGIGAGLSLDTGVGILLISAAVGSQMGLGLDFGRSKVHVGYVSLF